MWFRMLCVLSLVCCALFISPAVGRAQDDETSAIERAVEQAWWNQKAPIDALGLTSDLRGQMDELLQAQMEGMEGRLAISQLRRQIIDAVVAGEWQAAQEKSDQRAAVISEGQRRETELKIQVAKLLDPSQRQRLNERFPRLLSEPWIAVERAASRNKKGAGGPRRGN